MKRLDILTLLNVPSVGKRTVETILLKNANISSLSVHELFEILEETSLSYAPVRMPSKEHFFRIYESIRCCSHKSNLHVFKYFNLSGYSCDVICFY